MKDDPNRPRERERLAACQAIETAEAQIEGLERKLQKLEAEQADAVTRLEQLQEIIDANQAALDSIEAEYGSGTTEAGDGQALTTADVADAAWLAGDTEGNDA